MDLKKINTAKLLVEKRWIWHLVFWLFYAMSRLVMYYYTVVYYERVFLEFMLITEVSFIILIYITVWLYKKMLVKKRIEIYFFTGLLLWTFYLYFKIAFQKYYLISIPNIKNTDWFDIFIDSITGQLLTFFVITGLKYLKDNYIFQYQQNELKKHQLQFELENLKAQISPHFLFNTMNNFYGLAVEKSSKLPNLMIQLSELLRYSLYETKNEKVPLENEINYLENYIELEKIRLEDNLIVEFSCNKNFFKSFQIAPLLLITFLENAFKHSKNSANIAIVIKIFIDVTETGKFTFSITNSYDNQSKDNLMIKNGIGLKNVNKRLQAIYPDGKYFLTNSQSETKYTVTLILDLI